MRKSGGMMEMKVRIDVVVGVQVKGSRERLGPRPEAGI